MLLNAYVPQPWCSTASGRMPSAASRPAMVAAVEPVVGFALDASFWLKSSIHQGGG